MHQANKTIDGLHEELEKVTVDYEAKRAGFDAKMRDLDDTGNAS